MMNSLTNNNILVTGGAGYIGSHTCRQLIDAGYHVIIIDNLYSGHRWAIPSSSTFVEGNAGDIGLVRSLLAKHAICAVIHFAGHIVVPESLNNPLKYYQNNICASRNLLEACLAEHVEQFIFSSSAAVYGMPRSLPVGEEAATKPISPYGTTKLVMEWMLRDIAASPINIVGAAPFRFVALRYFNVAGARLDGTLGQSTPDATHLIKVACQAACGKRQSVSIFGTDYATPDGTCIRDYIHVDDLAKAHLDALAYLEQGGTSQVLNCGYGRGFSVREILNTVRVVSGSRFTINEEARRPGDPPALVADVSRIRQVLGWTPRYDNINVICETAYNWEKTSIKQ